jgi:hypothetical protein
LGSAQVVTTHRLAAPVTAVLYSVTIRLSRAEATIAGLDGSRPEGSNARATGKLVGSAVHASCRRCSASKSVYFVDSSCGPTTRPSGTYGLTLVVSNGSLKVPAGRVTITVGISGAATLPASPVVGPIAGERGTARVAFDGVVTSVEVFEFQRKVAFAEIVACPIDLPPAHPSRTVAAGHDTVLGTGYLKTRQGKPAGYIIFAAHGVGLGVGTTGAYAPGWFEALVSEGAFYFLVYRGSLSPGDLVVSEDGRTATLRLDLPRIGKVLATLKASPGGADTESFAGSAVGFGRGLEQRTWSLEADLYYSRPATIAGTAGKYTMTGVDPYDKRQEQFAFIAAGGMINTCQDRSDCFGSPLPFPVLLDGLNRDG